MKKVHRETRASQVFLERRVIMDLLELDFQAQLGLKESVEFQELRDCLESRVDRDRTA